MSKTREMMYLPRPAAAAVLLALSLSLPATTAQAQEIGTVALSVARVTGTPPAAATRALPLGTRVVTEEEVATGPDSRVELLFRDQTSLSLGANTAVVLDRFVFDPGTGSGDMALRLTQGALRMIGGATSDARPAVVTTPTATIGIRGSSALITSDGQQTTAVFIAGDELCLTPAGATDSFCTTQTGGLLSEAGFLGIVPADTLARITNLIDGVFAGDGGFTDLDLLDLEAVVPVDVRPFSTGGTQAPTGPDGLRGPPVPPVFEDDAGEEDYGEEEYFEGEYPEEGPGGNIVEFPGGGCLGFQRC
ncbi:FecR family protein [Roseicyclus amphidinii]|uniref:FecR family protein n=1 Tax=Roseicyclus amphidinii TaxID=3034232 RepID=UPI0024E07879|nr:FecR family protein [Roseicyclus sp. Amp-Y-6]